MPLSQKSHKNILSFPANQVTLLLTLLLKENTLNLLWMGLYSHAQPNTDSYSFVLGAYMLNAYIQVNPN